MGISINMEWLGNNRISRIGFAGRMSRIRAVSKRWRGAIHPRFGRSIMRKHIKQNCTKIAHD